MKQTGELGLGLGAVKTGAEQPHQRLQVGAGPGEQGGPSAGLAEPLELGREGLGIHGSDRRATVGQRGAGGEGSGHVLEPVPAEVRAQLGPDRPADKGRVQ